MNLKPYRQSLLLDGATQRDRIINKALHDTRKLAPTHPSYHSVTVDDIPRYLNIISTGVTTQKIIRTRPGEDITMGSIVYWGGSHWLITERDSDDEITVRGRIQVCQKEITWQDPDTLEIVSRWSTVEKPYYSNLAEDNIITYSTWEFRIQMPLDDYSSKLDLNKRLMLEIINGNPKTYRITSIDQMTAQIDFNGGLIGFLKINVEQDLYNAETDNAELMVCDYIEPLTVIDKSQASTESSHTLTISYADDPCIRIGGLGRYFTALLDGELCEDAEWEIICGSEYADDNIYFDGGAVTCSGSKCKICCNNDLQLVGETATVTATYKTITAKMEVEVVSL